jgi:kinesin family protein C2/C3
VTPLDVASCTGSSEALPHDDAMQQDTPDYIRRGAAARHRIAPLELFSAAAPSPAKSAAASLLSAAAPDSGAHEETVGCQSGHVEQVTSSGFADPNQSCW